MFDYLSIELSTISQEKHSFRLEIETLMNKLTDTKIIVARANINVTNLSLTNANFHTKKDNDELHANTLQGIIDNQAYTHHNLNKITDVQIHDQFEKILGGNIYEVVKVYKHVEIEPNFSTLTEIKNDYTSRFVNNIYINQTLVDKHCIINSGGLTMCTTK